MKNEYIRAAFNDGFMSSVSNPDVKIKIQYPDKESVFISIYGADQGKEILYSLIPVYEKWHGVIVHQRTLSQFLSIRVELEQAIKGRKKIIFSAFSLGASVGEIFYFWLMLNGYRKHNLDFLLMSPIKAVDGFSGVTYQVKSDIIGKWPFWKKGSVLKRTVRSPHPEIFFIRNHMRFRELVMEGNFEWV